MIIKRICVAIAITTIAISCATAQNKADKNRQEYAKSMSVIGSSLDLLNRHFVDSIDMKRTTRYGINAMLESLDPYTEYFSKEDADQLKMITTGEYGGIGAVIAQSPDSIVYINEPMYDMPADKAGLIAGDVILKVDSVDFRKATSAEVTKHLKGVPGTKVRILIQRYGEKKPRWIEIKREKVVINPVPYYGVLPDSIGYIALSTFTNSAADKVKDAIERLKKDKVKGLILDLRSNGGGLINEAIKIVGFFVPKGSEVVTTKGRNQDTLGIYTTDDKPIAADIPLSVLINSHSASASEIVAGALQDLDRAVIVGEKSFGKGLVQTTMRLPYEGILKLTTAKYYIPSGRCIQKINYHDVREGKGENILPDSLTAIFHTSKGREVHDAGGIMPDVKAQRDSLPTMILYLPTNKDVFDWVTKYVATHKKVAGVREFAISDEDYQDFVNMAKEKKIDYDRASGKVLERLIEVAKVEGYYNKNKEVLETLKKTLEPSLDEDLVNLKPQISNYLNNAIITRYYYNEGAVERTMLTDDVVNKAKSILLNPKEYNSILSPVKN